jgi:small subunit ribosomal protein S6
MRTYELLIILPPESDEQVVSGVVDRVSQPLAASGGKVERIDRWGRKRLAYEIARHQEGFYLLVDVSAEPESMKEIDRVLSLTDEVLRFKAVVKAA